MALPVKKSKSKSGKFVLFVGDEGAILVYMQGKRVVRRLFAATPEPTNTRGLIDALSNDPKAPVSILIDMIDQSYVKQTLPPVSQLSVNKLISRRLDRDFSKDDLKGAIILGREKDGRKDWNFLMVSLANTPILSKWIELVVERPNPFSGIFLLPIEAEIYTKKLVEKSGIKSDSKWQLLVTHNKVSGFRQVVFQNGRVTFTRMAQSIGESVPDVIAGNIEQEIINTTEYLKRMGFSEQAGLDTYIIVSDDIKSCIDPKKIKSTNVEIFTPHQVAEALDLQQAAMPEDHFGDVVFASFFGSVKKHQLTLHTPYTKKLGQFAAVSLGVKSLAGLIALGILYFIGSTAFSSYEIYQATKLLEIQKKEAQVEYEKTRELASRFPIGIEKITDVVTVYQMLDKPELTPEWVVEKIIKTLKNDAVVKSFSWELPEPMKVSPTADERKFKADVEIAFLVDETDSKALGKAASEFVERFKAEFKDFSITTSELPGLLEDNESFVIQNTPSGNTPTTPSAVRQNNTVRISISPLLTSTNMPPR